MHAALSDLWRRLLMHVMRFLALHLWHTREEMEAAEQAEKAAEQAKTEATRRKATAVRMLGSLREHPALPPVNVNAVLANNVYYSAPSTPTAATMQPVTQRALPRRRSTGSAWLHGKYRARRHFLGL